MSGSKAECCSVAIVGGGCSGLLTAVQLFRHGLQGSVSIIEPRDRLGAGLAYSTTSDQHLLNVPAGKMSVLPGQREHFLDWLRVGPWPQATADSFAPRRLFGEYLHKLSQQTIDVVASDRLRHLRAEALGFHLDAEGATIHLSDGRTVHARRVVLAVGNPASSADVASLRHGFEHCWNVSPWIGDALRVRFEGERVLLLGSGLTAVDAVLALQDQRARCQVYMLSRRGILPQVHNLRASTGSSALPLRDSGTLRGLTREFREHVRAARQADLCWRTVVDALRPVSNDIWQRLSLADRRRYQRHLKRYWEPHRHRMPPESCMRLNQHRECGSLEVIAGRFQGIRSSGDAKQVSVLLKAGEERVIEVDRMISCTGIYEDYRSSLRPAIRNVIKNGLARSNDLGFGFDTDEHGALLDSSMAPSTVFYTLGPPRRGVLFETTAVPEISIQADALAAYLTALEDTR